MIYSRPDNPKRFLVDHEGHTYLVPNISEGWDARVRVWYTCDIWHRVEAEREQALMAMLGIPH